MCFDFVVVKGLRWLRWFGWKNLESYVEMVAGLPRNEQKMKILYIKQKIDRTKDRTKNDYFVNQTKDRMASTNT